MFCRSFLLSTFIIFAVIFVSNLNATKCNNFQLKKDVITQEPHDGEECIGCTGYVCKINDGKILVGSACTETVKEICQQKWDDSLIQKIAKNDGLEVVNGKYFVHSCQEDYCNTVHWLHDYFSINSLG
uniref:Uncharacterized protein n=1 Tax=Panagrolaimus davidi TaxID=227884 RepID=A0A914Q769_9BILA